MLIKLWNIAEYINGRAFKPTEWEKDGFPIIRIQNLNNTLAQYNYSTKTFEEKYVVKQGDLLFARSASLWIYIWKWDNARLNQHIFKILPYSFVNKYYLYYALMNIIDEFYRKSHGSGMVHVTRWVFLDTEIFLPPLPHQTLIVDEIEKQLSRLDSGLNSLQKLKTLVKQYRASVLSSAVSGKLVSQEPSDEPASLLLDRILTAKKEKRCAENPVKKYKEPTSIDSSELGDLPDGWCWTNFDNVYFWWWNWFWKRRNDSWTETKVLRLADIEDWRIVWSTARTIAMNHNEIDKYKLNLNDLLFIRVNGSIDLCWSAILFNESELRCFCDHFIRVELPKNLVAPLYIKYFFDTDKARSYIQKNMVSSAWQNTINQSSLKAILLPLPPLPEQQCIVAEVERRFSVLDKLEQTIAENITRAQQLKQSILHQAFSGQLVKYEDSQEDVAELVKDIEEAKEELGKRVKKWK
jgi:type I restriction enzyme S subunit